MLAGTLNDFRLKGKFMDFNAPTSTVPIPAVIAQFVSNNPRAAAKLLNDHADAQDAAAGGNSAPDVPEKIAAAMNASAPTNDSGVNRTAVGQALNAVQPSEPKSSGVPSMLSKLMGADASVDMRPTAPSDTVPVPSLAVPKNTTQISLTPTASNPNPLTAAAKDATDTANAPDPLPPPISNLLPKPDVADIASLAAPEPDENGAPKESLGAKVKSRIPAILNTLGIVGGGLEAAFGPIGADPKGAEMFQHTLEAAKNRALTSRQLDIAQQKADTDEGYRRAAVGQFGLVPVQIPDPSDPNKTITIQVQQKDAAKYASAATTAGQRERTGTETNETKLAIARLKQMAETGQFKQLVPGLNPDSGQYEMQKIGKNGESLGWVPNSVVTALVQKTSDSGEWKQLGDGSFSYFPKQTISGPSAGQPTAPGTRVLSNAATSPNSSAASSANGNGQRTAVPTNTPATPRGFVTPTTPGGGSNAQNPVIGFDKDGQQVFTSAADAPKYGLTQIRKVGQAESEKVTNARSLMPIFNNNSPSDPGIIQLIDKLDKNGDLGVVASRWNEFLAGKVGAGNPLIEDLRTKMGLAETGLMQVHVGARGSAALMEHFHQLVNSGNMNPETMKSGIVTEFNYIKSKAMLPKAQPAPSTPAGNTPAQPNANPYGFVPASQ
jgi:hypothetical protein